MLTKFAIGIVGLLLSMSVVAQSPYSINYQGVARNTDGSPIANKAIGLRIGITQGPNGTTDYTEDHQVTTNEFGLFAVVIGKGQSGDNLQDVDWSAGSKWLQIELDAEGNGSFELVGTQQLMSVPYALFAQESADQLNAGFGISISNGNIINTLPDQTVGLLGTGGVAVTGSYPNYTIDGSALATTSYVDNSTSNVQTSVDGTQAELDATQAGAGLETDGTYVADGTTNYLGATTDLKDAAKTLDTEINANAGAISALSTALSTTYAFKGRFNFANTSGGDLNQDLPFSIDFAQDPTVFVGGDQFIAPEDGYYKITVDLLIDDGTADIIIINNGNSDPVIKFQIPGSTPFIHRKTTLYQLVSGDVISIRVENLLNGRIVTGEFTGYKL
jgi:hypothetical protein